MAVAKVVYIEDKPEMIELVRIILVKKGYQVLPAISGKDGLAIIRQEMPSVIILDLMMPDMDGWEVFRLIKSDPTTEHIPVIILTARGQSIDKVLGLHIAKVDDYITKPFVPSELVASIEKVLAQTNDGSGDGSRP